MFPEILFLFPLSHNASVPWITLRRDIHRGYPQVNLEAQLSTVIHWWMTWISTAGYISPQNAVGALEILSMPQKLADVHSIFQGNSIYSLHLLWEDFWCGNRGWGLLRNGFPWHWWNTIRKVQERNLKGFEAVFNFSWCAKLDSHFVAAGRVKLSVFNIFIGAYGHK